MTALDVSELHIKTTAAQKAVFEESLKQVTELLSDVGIINGVSPTILGFPPTSSMSNSAATARTAAHLRPLCAQDAITIIFEEGRKAIDAALRGLMNIRNEESVAEFPKVKAMRISVGWFSSPAYAVIYSTWRSSAQRAARLATSFGNGSRLRSRLGGLVSAADQKLLGFVEDMLDICGSRDLDYVCFMDTAVTVRLSHQEGSLKTFLED